MKEFIKDQVRWRISEDLVDYNSALKIMEEEVENILAGKEDLIWLLTHNHVYTAGTNIDKVPLDVEVIPTGRGGKITYHGPGQRIIYLMLNLAKMKDKKDIRQYVKDLQNLIISTLDSLGIKAYGNSENIGVWVNKDNQPKKIASLGIRVKKWVTFHGIALNIHTDLNYYNNISPCGLSADIMTSIKEMGKEVTFQSFDEKLIDNFYKIFKM